MTNFFVFTNAHRYLALWDVNNPAKNYILVDNCLHKPIIEMGIDNYETTNHPSDNFSKFRKINDPKRTCLRIVVCAGLGCPF